MAPRSRARPPKVLIWLLATAIGAGMAFAPPAAAHNSYQVRSGSVKCLPGQTTVGYAGIDHAYERITVYAGNPANGSCNFTSRYNAPPGWLYLGGQFYHDGVPPSCVGTGLIGNSRWTTELVWQSYADIWFYGCNRGAGVNTYITMDTTFYSYDTYGGRAQWDSGAWRPAVGHCHCP